MSHRKEHDQQNQTVYRVHLTSGDRDYPSKAEAFRQARNIASAVAAMGGERGIWVTKESVPVIQTA